MGVGPRTAEPESLEEAIRRQAAEVKLRGMGAEEGKAEVGSSVRRRSAGSERRAFTLAGLPKIAWIRMAREGQEGSGTGTQKAPEP